MTRNNYNHQARLWLALRFSALPLNALGFTSEVLQSIIVTEHQRVICSSVSARDAGVVEGMDMTTATLLTVCDVHHREPDLEVQALKQLSAQLYQFTPHIEIFRCSVTAQSGLLLEISRCLLLFSGVVALSARIFDHLSNSLYEFEYGLAHSEKAAWLLSFQHYAITGDENKNIFCERLKKIPVQLLYEYPQVVASLESTGFVTLGDIAKQIEAHSISSIKKRFGVYFANYICDIFVIEQNFQQASLFNKPINTYQPSEFFQESLQFDYPVNQLDQLKLPMENMLHSLGSYLRKRQLQCKQIEWTLYDIYHHYERITIRFDNPQTEAKLLYQLTYIQLEQRQLPFAIDTLELSCNESGPLQNSSQLLDFNQTGRGDKRTHNFATTAAKLKARLGDAAILKLSYCDSYLPEVSNITLPLAEKCNQNVPALHRIALRPVWLLAVPLLIERRSQGLYWQGYMRLIVGPERIQGNWWDIPAARDYFLAQRHDNLRLWVFLDLHKHRWFVQGIFG